MTSVGIEGRARPDGDRSSNVEIGNVLLVGLNGPAG